MPKRKNIDTKMLLKMIKDGTSQSEIMERFNFKNVTQLKVSYANALMESGEAPQLRGRASSKRHKLENMNVKVNSRGSLIITKEIIDILNIKIGQVFEVKQKGAGMVLRPVAEDSASPEDQTTEQPEEVDAEAGKETESGKADMPKRKGRPKSQK